MSFNYDLDLIDNKFINENSCIENSSIDHISSEELGYLY